MQKKLILITLLLLTHVLNAQEKNHNFIIKNNMLNYFLIPSIHLECRVAEKSSLVLNFHRGTLALFGGNNFTNISLDYRKYFSKKIDLTGFYLAPGLHYSHEYDVVKVDAQNYRCFCRLKQFRLIATRYEKLAERFVSFVSLVAGRVLLVEVNVNRP